MVQEGKATSRDNFTAKVIVTFVVEFLHFAVLLTGIVKYCRVYKVQFFRQRRVAMHVPAWLGSGSQIPQGMMNYDSRVKEYLDTMMSIKLTPELLMMNLRPKGKSLKDQYGTMVP